MKRQQNCKGKGKKERPKKVQKTNSKAEPPKEEVQPITIKPGWSGLSLALAALRRQLRIPFCRQNSLPDETKEEMPENLEFTGVIWLPGDVLIKILSMVPDGKSLLACRCVSKYWKFLTMDPSVAWLKIETRLLSPQDRAPRDKKDIVYDKVSWKPNFQVS